MTTRDAFACAAMQEIMSALKYKIKSSGVEGLVVHEIASASYEVADAMMKHRRKHPLRRASRSRKSVGFSTVA